jgi:hydroxyacylglutathione hydrolase
MAAIYPVKLGFVTCYLVESDNHYILVDAGYPNKEKILWKFLEKKGIAPTDIGLIVITHGHVDHVGSLKAIKEKTRAPVLIHEFEGPLLQDGRTPGVHITIGWLAKLIRMEQGTKVKPVAPDIMIADEFPLTEFGIDGKVIPTPGHTAGSLTVVIEGKHAIVGDIAMKFPLLSTSYEPVVAQDMDQIYRSWQKLLDSGVQTIYPAHGAIVGAEVLKELIAKRGRS